MTEEITELRNTIKQLKEQVVVLEKVNVTLLHLFEKRPSEDADFASAKYANVLLHKTCNDLREEIATNKEIIIMLRDMLKQVPSEVWDIEYPDLNKVEVWREKPRTRFTHLCNKK
jgi:hypothetical protein